MTANEMQANVVYESFSADYTTPIHHAMRPDGQWFERARVRDPRYGWRNTAWRPSLAPDHGRDTGRSARLPK